MPSINEVRVPALEILIDTPRIKDLIKFGKIDQLLDAMEQGVNEGCQSFEHALFTLYKQGMISVEQAIANSDTANNLRLKIKLDGSGGDDELYKLSGRDQKGNNELRIKSERSPLPNAFRKL